MVVLNLGPIETKLAEGADENLQFVMKRIELENMSVHDSSPCSAYLKKETNLQKS